MEKKIKRATINTQPWEGKGFSLLHWDELNFDQKAVWLAIFFILILVGVPLGLWVYWTFFTTELDTWEWMKNLEKKNKK